jgi:hypothetical protein
VPAGSYKVQLLSDRFLSFHNIKTDKTQIGSRSTAVRHTNLAR